MKRLLALGVLLLLPQFVSADFILTMFVFTFILGILAVSFNLIFGFTGQLSMFHAAAFGLSAYATHLSMTRLGTTFWVGLLFAMGFILVLSTIIGFICFRYRLKEFYFAVVTLAFAEIARLTVLNWTDVTNGSLGVALVDKPTLWNLHGGVIAVQGSVMWYYVSLVALVITIIVCSRIVGSWMGRCFEAIRLNEELAGTLGIDVTVYKLLAFAIGNVLAAVAGALYAYYIGYIEPEYLSIAQSLAIVAMVLLGGRETIVGPVVGAFVLTALPHVIDLSAEMRILVYGSILIATILLLPRGLLGSFRKRRPATGMAVPHVAPARPVGSP